MNNHSCTMRSFATVLLFILLSNLLSAQNPTPDSTSKTADHYFSVSSDTRVRFAPGNLQYQPSTKMWRFAPSQIETLGWKESYSYPRYRGWIDLFGWGTALTPTNYSDNSQEYNFVDWGLFCGLPTGDGKQWRTLSLSEWTYLLSQRPKARRLYALAYVCGQYGLILLPDNWQRPKGIPMRTGPKEEGTNIYNATRWQTLEAAGAVFLPASVRRIGTLVQGSASACRYWISSPNPDTPTEALYLLVNPYLPQIKSAPKSHGLSVRLVQNY